MGASRLKGRVVLNLLVRRLGMFPILPHDATGVDCPGCIVAHVRGQDAELVCNECGAVVGVINTAILADLLSLIGTRPKG